MNQLALQRKRKYPTIARRPQAGNRAANPGRHRESIDPLPHVERVRHHLHKRDCRPPPDFHQHLEPQSNEPLLPNDEDRSPLTQLAEPASPERVANPG